MVKKIIPNRWVIILLFLVLLNSTIAFGDGSCVDVAPPVQWNRTFGDASFEEARSAQQTSDGGFILAGRTDPIGPEHCDFWLLKTDPYGNEEWNKTFGGVDYDHARSVHQTSDGGYIMAGEALPFGSGNYDFWLVKTDSAGNEEWNQNFDSTESDYACSVQQTSDGGFIVTGYTMYLGPGDIGIWLVKTDPCGLEEWNQTFGGTSREVAYSVQQTSDGGYILAGYTESFGAGSFDFWLVKTDSNGNEEWNQTYGGTGSEEAQSVQQTSDGGYILAGCTNSFGAGEYDFWLVKTDPSGNEEWNKTFGGIDDEFAYSVQQTSDGGYILAGCTASFGEGNFDFWLVKTDPYGNEEWKQTYGGTESDYACSGQQTSDGGFIAAGTSYSFGTGSYDFLLVKFNHTDVDGDGLGDLCDPCPSDSSNLCNPDGSGAEHIEADEGGVVESEDGSVTIVIDPCDLYEDTTISVTKLNTNTEEVDICLETAPGQCQSGNAEAYYQFEPDGLEFANPVTIIFTVEVEMSNEQQCNKLGVYLYKGGSNWERIPDTDCESSYDEGSGICSKTCTIEVDHFSIYGLIAPIVKTGLLGGWGKDDDSQASGVPAGNDYVAVTGGYEHSLTLKADGSLISWGRDNSNQVTDTPGESNFIDISAGSLYSLALKNDGSIVAWGDDDYGQVTDAPTDSNFIAISGGASHSLALKNDGSIVAWGNDQDGRVSNTPTVGNFTAIAAGGSHGLALKNDGSLVSWGKNNSGQVSNTPTDSNYVAVAAGCWHSLALKNDGSIVAWGYDAYNQVTDTPTDSNYVSISAGYFYNLALKADGSLVSWGQDDYGQVTDGPTAGNFISIDAGAFHSLVLYQCKDSLSNVDLNGDCYVDFKDLAIFCDKWLECGSPFDPGCNP